MCVCVCVRVCVRVRVDVCTHARMHARTHVSGLPRAHHSFEHQTPIDVLWPKRKTGPVPYRRPSAVPCAQVAGPVPAVAAAAASAVSPPARTAHSAEARAPFALGRSGNALRARPKRERPARSAEAGTPCVLGRSGNALRTLVLRGNVPYLSGNGPYLSGTASAAHRVRSRSRDLFTPLFHNKLLQLSVADVDAILSARLAPVIPVPESTEEYR